MSAIIKSADAANDDGEPLVVSMTRPTMIAGMFTLESIIFSVCPAGTVALALPSFYPLLVIPVFLLGSYLVCLKDPYLFAIATASLRLKRCVNYKLHGCRRYAPR